MRGLCRKHLLISSRMQSENQFLDDHFRGIFSSHLKHGSVLKSVSVKCHHEVYVYCFPFNFVPDLQNFPYNCFLFHIIFFPSECL